MTLRLSGSVTRGGFTLSLDLTVPDGEVLGVIGPNGAGKSTLLRVLAGLTALTEGSLRLGGSVLDDSAGGVFVPPERRPVGLVFQNYRLFPHLSVRDNVAYARRSHGHGRQQARAAAEDWLARLQITEFGDRRPAELSGGQAQRVALARALAAEPGLLLLDEPLAALDARTRLQVRTELKRHLAEFTGPTLVVTHDPLEAMVLTDRLLVIEDGRVVQDAAPAEVARRPATAYVAGLVGLNLYRGTSDGHGSVSLDDGGTFAVAGEIAGRVHVALRPSAITLHAGRPGALSARNVWPGTVIGLELLTDRVRVEIDGAPPALVDITPAAVADLDLTPGAPVWLSAKSTEADSYAAT